MKIYKLYYLMTEDEYKSHYALLDKMNVTYIDSNNIMYLYGFTNNKKLFNIFRYIHDEKNSKVIVSKIESDEYDSFFKTNKYSRINMVDLSYDKKNSLTLPLSFIEDINIRDFGDQNLYDLLSDSVTVDFRIFNDNIKNALKFLNYDLMYINLYGTEDEMDVYSWNSSYERNRKNLETVNEVGLYLNMYKKYLRPNNLLDVIQKGGLDEII